MSETPSRPEQEPTVDNLPTPTDEEARPTSDGEAESLKGGLGFPDYTKVPVTGGIFAPAPLPNFGK